MDWIASGGFGSVHRVIRDGREFALKTLMKHHLGDVEIYLDFLREIAIHQELGAHPHLPQMFDAGVWNGVPFIVFRRVRGVTFWKLVQTGLTVQDALRVTQQTARALSHAHSKGIIHRDVKPSNILVCGQTREAFLIDFGAARAPRSVTGMDPKDFEIGTQGYRSPEQARGEPVSPASDVFMLGATLHFAVHGECIYGLGTEADMHHRSRAGDVRPLSHSYHPKGLAELLERSTAPKMTDRHQTIDAFQEDLERVLWADFDD